MMLLLCLWLYFCGAILSLMYDQQCCGVVEWNSLLAALMWPLTVSLASVSTAIYYAARPFRPGTSRD